MKKLWGSVLKLSALFSIVAGTLIIFITGGYLLVLGLYFFVIAFILYIGDFVINKFYWGKRNLIKNSIVLLYVLVIFYSYEKWQEHTKFIFPKNFNKTAGIIFGINGYPKLPPTFFWHKRIVFPDNGIIITSTIEEDMPKFQKFYSEDGNQKNVNEINWDPNFSYDCLLNNNVIKAWLFSSKRDTGTFVQKRINELANQINTGLHSTIYKSSGNLTVHGGRGSYITLQGNNLFYLPDIVSDLRINTIYLAENNFKTIPPQIYTNKSIREIVLNKNPIKELPANLYKIERLKSLSVGSTLIRSINIDMSRLDSLTYLDISANHLSTFPNNVKAIPNLKELALNDNSFDNLSFIDDRLGKLENLEIYTNKIRSINGLRHLKKLKELLIFDNQIDSLSAEIGNLKNLEKLEIWNNPIKYISPEIKHLSKLKYLLIDDNYLSKLDKLNLQRWLPKCDVHFQTR